MYIIVSGTRLLQATPRINIMLTLDPCQNSVIGSGSWCHGALQYLGPHLCTRCSFGFKRSVVILAEVLLPTGELRAIACAITCFLLGATSAGAVSVGWNGGAAAQILAQLRLPTGDFRAVAGTIMRLLLATAVVGALAVGCSWDAAARVFIRITNYELQVGPIKVRRPYRANCGPMGIHQNTTSN